MRVFGRKRPPHREDHDLLDASLAVAQTQMLGQLADETALDGRTMGLAILIVGLVTAASLITFDQPDKLKPHGRISTTPSATSQGFR